MTSRRIAAIDMARTIAIAAMVVFHFTYDLEIFGFVASGTMGQAHWIWFARLIAGSFIFLSGFSLILSAMNGPVLSKSYFIRLAMIGAGSIAVSLGTYFALGNAFVRFGILHNLFAASLLGLAFVRAPFVLNAALGLVLLTLPLMPVWPFVPSNALMWLALPIEPVPPMVDYIPILPWFGAFLLGMASAQTINRLGLWPTQPTATKNRTSLTRFLSWPGKHSLAIYLIHQPIIFGSLYVIFLLTR